MLISGIRYDFTPAVARERNYNPVHFVVIVELVVVQQTTLALREDGGVGFLVMHRVFLVGLLEGRIAHFHCGDALWQMRLFVGHIEITILSKCHGSYPVRGRQSVDERNVYGIGRGPWCQR